MPLPQLLERLTVLADDADGLTVSGGEPFEQPEALAAVLARWRSVSGTSTLVFTGREFDGVEGWLSDNPDLIDALVTGPFRSDLPQTLALRGSDNQLIHVLSARGSTVRSYDRLATVADRSLDIAFDEQGHAWLAGIPARGDMARLRRVLASAGHASVTSDMVGAYT